MYVISFIHLHVFSMWICMGCWICTVHLLFCMVSGSFILSTYTIPAGNRAIYIPVILLYIWPICLYPVSADTVDAFPAKVTLVCVCAPIYYLMFTRISGWYYIFCFTYTSGLQDIHPQYYYNYHL
ncbi:p110_8L [African swine fever virus]|uniref:p110_8L n=1 Tax=African swine fever virus TaxID=10497 RepID=A0A6G7KT33_ASF|nr:p110_8L [African swine fever virus]